MPDIHPNDPRYASIHIWDVWNEVDYTAYRNYRPRFVAEFGFQAPPTYATLRSALPGEELRPDSPGMLHHQKAVDGNGKLARGLAPHFGNPADFDDWQLSDPGQPGARLLWHRALPRSVAPHGSGLQLNDCWPVTSWSAVDGEGRRNRWHALRYLRGGHAARRRRPGPRRANDSNRRTDRAPGPAGLGRT